MILSLSTNELNQQAVNALLRENPEQQHFASLYQQTTVGGRALYSPHTGIDPEDKILIIVDLGPTNVVQKSQAHIFANTLLAGSFLDHVESVYFLMSDTHSDKRLSRFVDECRQIIMDANLDGGIALHVSQQAGLCTIIKPPVTPEQDWEIITAHAETGDFIEIRAKTTREILDDPAYVYNKIPGRDEKFDLACQADAARNAVSGPA